jgi:hypothetical protein
VNREKALAMSKVMAHWCEGGQVQIRPRDMGTIEWTTARDTDPLAFDFEKYDYRIKPIPRKFFYVGMQDKPDTVGAIFRDEKLAAGTMNRWAQHNPEGNYEMIELQEVIR